MACTTRFHHAPCRMRHSAARTLSGIYTFTRPYHLHLSFGLYHPSCVLILPTNSSTRRAALSRRIITRQTHFILQLAARVSVLLESFIRLKRSTITRLLPGLARLSDTSGLSFVQFLSGISCISTLFYPRRTTLHSTTYAQRAYRCIQVPDRSGSCAVSCSVQANHISLSRGLRANHRVHRQIYQLLRPTSV